MPKSNDSAVYLVLAWLAVGVYLFIGGAAVLGLLALVRDVLGGPPAPAAMWSVAFAYGVPLALLWLMIGLMRLEKRIAPRLPSSLRNRIEGAPYMETWIWKVALAVAGVFFFLDVLAQSGTGMVPALWIVSVAIWLDATWAILRGPSKRGRNEV